MKLRQRLGFGLERNAALLFWALFFVQFSFGISDRLRTLFMESIGASPTTIGLMLGISEAIRLVFLLASGPVSERVSPRVLIGFRWFAVVYAVIWLTATSPWMLYPAFLAMALANMAWPPVSRVIDESGPPEERQRRFLLIYTVGPSVALLGAPLLGAYLASRYGLRSVFAALAIGVFVSCIFFTLVRPQSRPVRTAGGGYLDVLKHRPSGLICLLTLLTSFVTWLGLTLVPNYLHNEYGVSYGLIGSFGSLVAVGAIMAAVVLSRVRALSRTLNGAVVASLFLPPCFLLLLGGDYAIAIGFGYLLSGIASVAMQTLSPAISEVTPPSMRVRSFALIEATYAAGVMLAGFASGALYDIGPQVPLVAGTVGAVLVVGATLWVRREIIGWQVAGGVMPETGP